MMADTAGPPWLRPAVAGRPPGGRPRRRRPGRPGRRRRRPARPRRPGRRRGRRGAARRPRRRGREERRTRRWSPTTPRSPGPPPSRGAATPRPSERRGGPAGGLESLRRPGHAARARERHLQPGLQRRPPRADRAQRPAVRRAGPARAEDPGNRGLSISDIGVQTLPQGQRTTLQVPAHVRQSGSFAVTAQLTTPERRSAGRPRAMQVKSTAYGSISLLITFGAAALLGCCSSAGWCASSCAAGRRATPRRSGVPPRAPRRHRPTRSPVWSRPPRTTDRRRARSDAGAASPRDDRDPAPGDAARPARRSPYRRRLTARTPPPSAPSTTPFNDAPSQPPPYRADPAAGPPPVAGPRPAAGTVALAAPPGPAAAAPSAAGPRRAGAQRLVPIDDDTQVMTSLPPVPRRPVETDEDVEARRAPPAPAAASSGRPGRWPSPRWSPGSPG